VQVAKLELEGLEELIDAVQKMGKEGRKIENKALKEAGGVIKEAIQQEAPEGTGKLKKSITVSNIKTKDGVRYVEVGPNKEGWYGRFVEFGTVKMRANPFMARGYERAKDQALAVIKEELKRGLGL
jgi:HK97 gp10 family phage protein